MRSTMQEAALAIAKKTGNHPVDPELSLAFELRNRKLDAWSDAVKWTEEPGRFIIELKGTNSAWQYQTPGGELASIMIDRYGVRTRCELHAWSYHLRPHRRYSEPPYYHCKMDKKEFTSEYEATVAMAKHLSRTKTVSPGQA